jgi:hypothetical protein
MRLARSLVALVSMVAMSLCATGTASAAGTRPVTTSTETVTEATCSAPVQKGNVLISTCTGGVETWSGDITGTGRYSYEKIVNQTNEVRVTRNGVETIEEACVLGTCGGTLYTRWNENVSASEATKIEQSFQGGTGPFTKAHGSIRLVGPVYLGQVGL